MNAKGIVEIRAEEQDLSSEKGAMWRMMLCENTVPSARMAPSEVDMDAATMPSRPHPPRKAGGRW